jgi:flagellar motility protein MotE (MotC chaperone)
MDAARRKHEKDTADIRAQLQALEERAQAEEARWEREKGPVGSRRCDGREVWGPRDDAKD